MTQIKSRSSKEMPPRNFELDLKSNSDVDKNRQNHPAAYNKLVPVVQQFLQPTLPTPASTPRDQAPTPLSLSSQHITQEEKPDCDSQTDQHENGLVDQSTPVAHQHENLFVDPQSLSVVIQGPSQGGRASNYAYTEGADAGDKQTCDNSQRSTNLDVSLPNDHHNTHAPRDKQPAEHTVTSAPHQGTTQHTSKRKQNFEDGIVLKRTHIELADAAEGRPESSSHDRDKYQLGRTMVFSRAGTLASLEDLRTNRIHDYAIIIQKNLKAKYYRRKYLEVRSAILLIQSMARGYLARQGTRKIRAATTIQRVWRGHKQRQRFNSIRNSADRGFTLSEDFRSKLRRIKTTGFENAHAFFYTMRHPTASIDVRPDQDALDKSGGPHTIPTRDRRLKQLRFLIDDTVEKEQSLKTPEMVVRLERRVYLVELTDRYMEASAMPKKKGQPSVKNWFTDMLFPETIRDKSKGKQVSDEKSEQQQHKEEEEEEERKKQRKKAKKKLEYWLRLGEPLWRITEAFGFGILLLLPDNLREGSLNNLTKDQYQEAVDYINLCYPNLKEELSHLSTLLPGIIADGPSTNHLVIETISSHELLNYSLKDLFQFSTSSDPVDRLVEEPSQLPVDTNDTQQANGQMLTNQTPLNSQDAIKSVQSPQGASEYSRWPSPATGIDNGTPRDFLDFGEESAQSSISEDLSLSSTTTGIGKDGHPSSPQLPSAVWAGETEYNPPGIAILARNEMIHGQYS